MLCLSRKKDEKIIIGDNIEIMILEVKNGIVRLGFTAPKEVSIHREEVYRKVQKENN